MGSTLGNNERGRLESLGKYGILDTPEEPAFDDLAKLAAEMFHAPVSLISFLDGDREWFKSKVGTDRREIPRDHAFASRVIRGHDLVVVPDATSDEELRDNPFVKDNIDARFFAGYPLVDRDGMALGALYVVDRKPHELNDHEQQLFRILSHEAVMLLELRREIREGRRRNEQTTAELERVKALLETESVEHARIENELKKRERQLADAQHITHLGSWEWDLATNSVTWSDELYRIYGLKPHQFDATYAAYLHYVHPEDRVKTNQAIEHALVTQDSFAHEERIVRVDGTVRTLYSCGEVMCDDRGHSVRMVGCCHDITDQKETENRLKHTMSLLNATIEATADGILVVDRHRHIVQYNHRFLEMWHWPPEFMSLYDDWRLLELAAEQLKDPEWFLQSVKDVNSAPEKDSFHLIEFKDGRYFERYSRPQRLGNKIVGRVWSFRDVSERRRALNVLRLSEERYRSLVVATAQVVWTSDPHGDITEDSPSWREFTGQTFQEMRLRGWLNAVHPADRLRVAEQWNQSVAKAAIYQNEARLRHKHEGWRYVSVRGVPVREPDGRIREWVGFCVDITEFKHANELVLKERDFSNALIAALPGIFYVLDETGLNLRHNRNLEKVSGYSRAEISKMHAMDFVPNEEKVLLAQRVQQVFAKGEADVELTIQTKTGERIPFYCTGKLLHTEQGPRLVGVGIDMSAVKRAKEEVDRLNTQLEQRVQERTEQLDSANKELASFTYTASHDLRSPIRSVIGFARALREDSGGVLEEENLDYLNRIIQSGERMMQLIDDLLAYCRVGQQTFQLNVIALDRVLNETVQRLEPTLKQIGATVTIDPDLPRVRGEVTLLHQVFSNLLENSITYRKRDVPLRIDIGATKRDNNVLIRVADNGIGIAPQNHQRIFEVFQRLHHPDQYPGTGVGLATVKRSAEKMGGEVWVESELNKGSTFCILLKTA